MSQIIVPYNCFFELFFRHNITKRAARIWLTSGVLCKVINHRAILINRVFANECCATVMKESERKWRPGRQQSSHRVSLSFIYHLFTLKKLFLFDTILIISYHIFLLKKEKRNQEFNAIFIFEILIILNVVIIRIYVYFTDQCSCITLCWCA